MKNRKYRTERNYRNKLECFTCGSVEHLANTCPKRINNKTRNSQLIEDFQETLINVDEYMSDTESIYSIVSVDTEEKIKTEFERNKGLDSNACFFCKWYPSRDKRVKCKNCYIEGCTMCIEKEFKTKINKETTHKKIEDPTISLRIITLETRINELETRLCNLERGKNYFTLKENYWKD